MHKRDWPNHRFEVIARHITLAKLIKAETRDEAEYELHREMDAKFGEGNWSIYRRGAPAKPKAKVAGMPKRGPITKCKPTRVIEKPLKPAGHGISNYRRVEKYGLSKVSRTA